MDDGIGNQWNTSIGNYWSDFDIQSDFYQIPGDANSTDYEPIAEEITISTNDDDLPSDENPEKSGFPGYSWGLIAGSAGLASFNLIYRKKEKFTIITRTPGRLLQRLKTRKLLISFFLLNTRFITENEYYFRRKYFCLDDP